MKIGLRWISGAVAAAAVAGCGSGGTPQGFSTLYQTANNPNYDFSPAIFSIRGSSPSDIWVTGQFGTAVHYTGGHWNVVPTPASGSLADLTAVTASNAYAFDVVRNDMYQWNGHEWDEVGGADDTRYAIWADAVDSVWGVGRAQSHWDGAAWSPVTSQLLGSYLGPIDGLDTSTMYAVVSGGGIASSAGGTWNAIYTVNTNELYGLWVDSATDVWFVGKGGTVLRWDGGTVASVDAGTMHDLTAVTGTGPDDVWIGGDQGTVVHWDGTAWSYATTPSGQDINCMWAPRPREVWIGDVSGAVLQDAL
jgi:hypothetical protein